MCTRETARHYLFCRLSFKTCLNGNVSLFPSDSANYANFINASPGSIEVVVGGLDSDTLYMFRVVGGDELGPGPPSNVLMAKTYHAGTHIIGMALIVLLEFEF